MAHNASVELWLADMRATPCPTETTTPYRCSECGASYSVTRGRHSAKAGKACWMMQHGLNPHCRRAWFERPAAMTREQAMEHLREICETNTFSLAT